MFSLNISQGIIWSICRHAKYMLYLIYDLDIESKLFLLYVLECMERIICSAEIHTIFVSLNVEYRHKLQYLQIEWYSSLYHADKVEGEGEKNISILLKETSKYFFFAILAVFFNIQTRMCIKFEPYLHQKVTFKH